MSENRFWFIDKPSIDRLIDKIIINFIPKLVPIYTLEDLKHEAYLVLAEHVPEPCAFNRVEAILLTHFKLMVNQFNLQGKTERIFREQVIEELRRRGYPVDGEQEAE